MSALISIISANDLAAYNFTAFDARNCTCFGFLLLRLEVLIAVLKS